VDTKQMAEQADLLFGKRTSFVLHLQDVAENFYPERADFTYQRTMGNQMAGDLMTSYPLLCRRDLGDQIGQMLRPTAKEWFHSAPLDPGRENNDAKKWLQWADKVQRRAMFDRTTNYTRAAKEADHDYAAFGQYVKRIRLNRERNGLLYTCYHLRDCVWMEDADGKICFFARRYKATARDLKRSFKAVHTQVEQFLTQNKPFEEIQCYHMSVAADLWSGNARGKPWVSIYWDVDHEYCLEEMPQWTSQYVTARWQTVSGSQYAFSPATICALPEARLIQAMAYTLLEAGEKAVNPPMAVTSDVVKSDVAIYPGGLTWIDRDYDERLGSAIRPLYEKNTGLPYGVEAFSGSQQMIMQAFFLNKLTLPQRTAEMTAYEVGQRVQEYIRNALPLFEPMEHECNGQECEMTFDLLMRAGAFGSPMDMPKSLQGAEIKFGFVSPLHDALEQIKGQKFAEARGMIAEAMALDQGAGALVDVKVALRDTLQGIGTPAIWIRSEVEMEDIEAQQQAAAQAQQTLAAMQQGADVAGTMATAQKDKAAAQQLMPA
jgi:hypothetical protein